jgi:SAM-dependent methyltransferase
VAFGDQVFEAAFCAAAIYQMPGPQQVVGELVRVLRTGGILGLSVFVSDDPNWPALGRLYQEMLPPLPVEGEPQDARSLRRLLTDAGLTEVRLETRKLDVAYEDASDWLANAWSHGERRAFEAMGAEEYEDFVGRLPDALEPTRGADGRLHWRPGAVYAVGRRP